MEPNILDYWFGNTAPTIPGIVYVGLIIQAGTLSTALTAGTSYTSLLCASNTVAYNIASADILLLGTGSTTQVVQASALANAGATSVSVSSFIANATYAIGTPFIRCDVYATAQEPSSGSYARVAVTNNTTNFPASAAEAGGVGGGYVKQNGTAITFPLASGSWGTVAGFLVADNITPGTGNLFAFGALNAAQLISTNNTPSFPTNSLNVTLV
jgi:hypothetical protein